MTKQNNIEEWENGDLGQDEAFVEKVDIDKEIIKEFVEGLYKDGFTASERFGLTWEMLEEIEKNLFGSWLLMKNPINC